jgi:hypothetical protein
MKIYMAQFPSVTSCRAPWASCKDMKRQQTWFGRHTGCQELPSAFMKPYTTSPCINAAQRRWQWRSGALTALAPARAVERFSCGYPI